MEDLVVERADEIGPWSEYKLELLGKYLPAYMRIMSRQRAWCRGGVHFVDGFAGTGQPRARGEDRVVKGSPRIALDLPDPFDSYTFIDVEPWRASSLRDLGLDYPDRKITVVEDDCNAAIVREITPNVRRDKLARGFVLLDPFGTQLRWETIEAIAETGALEVMLNFPVMALQRAALPSGIATLRDDQVRRMSDLWGSDEWREKCYRRVQSPAGEVDVKRPVASKYLAQLFAERLRTVFGHVNEPLEFRNSRGGVIYFMIFAGHNANGAKIAADVFRPGHRQKAATPVPLPLNWDVTL